MRESEREEVQKKKIGRVILVFIALLVIISNGSIRSKLKEFISNNNGELESKMQIEVNLTQNADMDILNDKVVLVNDTTISTYDLDGDAKNIAQIDNSSIVKIKNEKIYTVNKANGRIKVFDIDGELIWEYELNKSINNIKVGDSLLTVISTSENGNSILDIFNNSGKHLIKEQAENGQVVSVDFLNETNEYLTSIIKVDESSLISSLSKHSLSGEMVWEDSFEDEIIQEVVATNKGTIILITDKKIYCITKNKELLWNRSIDGDIWDVAVDTEQGKIIVLTGGNKGYLESIDFDGRTEYRIKVNTEYSKIKIAGKNILLYGGDKIIGISSGDQYMEHNFSGDIKDIELSNKYIYVLLQDKIKIMKRV
ncbi:DUF5711 family protein [Sporosalibacterium faouarense]|uniref:DUF5711 family protein n=1 Tax=Sporosalibacterium faouarense TaxID=516123 RepID=UPI00192BC4C6|nr:DUF5711 family protein [Sporosalibacterium faouarense]